MAYNIFIFILFYSIAVVPCIGMYNKALNGTLGLESWSTGTGACLSLTSFFKLLSTV